MKSFVFTADHGFLLQDETTQDAALRHEARSAAAPRARRAPARRGRHGPRVACRRSATTGSRATCSSATTPRSSRPATPAPRSSTAATALRSGSSRCSPSRGSARSRAASPSTRSRSRPQADVLGLHRLRLRVVFTKAPRRALGFATARDVGPGLRVPDREAVRVILKDVTEPGEAAGRPACRCRSATLGPRCSSASKARATSACTSRSTIPRASRTCRSATPEPWYSVSGTRAARSVDAAVCCARRRGLTRSPTRASARYSCTSRSTASITEPEVTNAARITARRSGASRWSSTSISRSCRSGCGSRPAKAASATFEREDR